MLKSLFIATVFSAFSLCAAHPDFQDCARYVRDSEEEEPRHITTKLKVYGLYKQAMLGDCDEGIDTSKEDVYVKLKHEAWCSRFGMSKDQAETEYVVLIDELVPDWRLRQ